MQNIAILGAGVSGITTGILLQSAGFKTIIYGSMHLSIDCAPRFASSIPSASVIPHTVFGDTLKTVFGHSIDFFEQAYQKKFPGLCIHKHYELFEKYNTPEPEYLGLMKNPEVFSQDTPLKGVPHRKKSTPASGWSFDCFFADWPIYSKALYSHYLSCGGRIVEQNIDMDFVKGLPNKILINCLGASGDLLFEETSINASVKKGHLIHIPNLPLLKNEEGKTVSYNYTVSGESFISSDGKPQDVYAYSRSDGWILGGTRLSGTLDRNGNWSGESVNENLISDNKVGVPEQILNINREIIRETFGHEIHESAKITGIIGYRYMRKEKSGFAVELRRLGKKSIISNLGHGGAGVTLSWGAAFKCVELACEICNLDRIPTEKLKKEVFRD